MIVNNAVLPFKPNKYVHAFSDVFAPSIVEGEDGKLYVDSDLAEKAEELFVVEFEKMREEYREFVAEFPANSSVYTLFNDPDNAARFMEEGYDLLQALCQFLMMGSMVTGAPHDAMVAATMLKCLSRDKTFYQPGDVDECLREGLEQIGRSNG